MLKILRNRKAQRIAAQLTFLGALLSLAIAAYLTALKNLREQGIVSGFDFLHRSTGFDIGYSFVGFSANDTYLQMILAGIANTIVLGAMGIAAANVIGVIVAVLRISNERTVNFIGAAYVESFRSIPIILQILFWYSALSHLPPPRDAYNILDVAYLTGRGLYLPALNISAKGAVLLTVLLVASIAGLLAISRLRDLPSWLRCGRRHLSYCFMAVALLGFLGLFLSGRTPGSPLFSLPQLSGLNFSGGVRLPPEFLSIAIGIALYGGAYIAEIIRAGFNSIPTGQTEAASALGLRNWQVLMLVRIPLAVRAILPALTNQYVWLFKATTLGIAVGYSDFFMVTSVSITQSGQTIELFTILIVGFLIMNNTLAACLNVINSRIKLR